MRAASSCTPPTTAFGARSRSAASRYSSASARARANRRKIKPNRPGRHQRDDQRHRHRRRRRDGARDARRPRRLAHHRARLPIARRRRVVLVAAALLRLARRPARFRRVRRRALARAIVLVERFVELLGGLKARARIDRHRAQNQPARGAARRPWPARAAACRLPCAIANRSELKLGAVERPLPGDHPIEDRADARRGRRARSTPCRRAPAPAPCTSACRRRCPVARQLASRSSSSSLAMPKSSSLTKSRHRRRAR